VESEDQELPVIANPPAESIEFSCPTMVCRIHRYLLMRTSPAVRVLALFLLLTAPLSASIKLRVDEIGLKGWSGWSARALEPVRFTVENDGPAETLNLRIITVNRVSDAVSSVREERFLVPTGTTQVMRLIDVTPSQSLRFELSGDDKNVVAYATSAGLTRSVIRGHLVAVYCHDPLVFENVRRSAIQSDDVQVRTRKERELDFVRVDTLELEPWYYNNATAIVVAEPLNATPQQKRALELYVRGGGQLGVDPKTASSTGFNSAYFVEGESVRMGLGTVYEVTDFEPRSLSSFSTNFLEDDSIGETVLDHVAWRMQFPKTRTMILLTISYIVIIGAVNFAILRRIGRLELGWITVPVIALLFTLMVVGFGVSRGFSKVRIDQAETYYMDTHSATAYIYDGVRVTSPSRGEFTLQLAPGDYFASTPNNFFGGIDKVHIGDDILEQHSDTLRRTWHFTANGDRMGVALSMMRWSYDEWFGKRFEDLQGTVSLSGITVKNGTGVRFRRSIIVDRDTRKLYDLGALDVNATSELRDPRQLPPREYAPWRGKESQSPDLDVWTLTGLATTNKVFVGVAEGDVSPATQPRISDLPSQQTHTRVFVVGLE
jgi:hypothetical protein